MTARLKSRQQPAAFTRTDLVVIVLIVLIFVACIESLTATPGAKGKAQRIACANNLKEIGIAYGLWAAENGNLTPSQQTVALGGWKDLLTNADQGPNCWTNYAILGNSSQLSPRMVLCPTDDRTTVASWFSNATSEVHPTAFNNTTLSYFVSVSATAAAPRSIQGGDPNLGSGEKPEAGFGFSSEGGQGNDVAIPMAGRVSWSLKIHSAGKAAGAGNVLLGDGSVQRIATEGLNKSWLRMALTTRNWPPGHVPSSPSIRLVFP